MRHEWIDDKNFWLNNENEPSGNVLTPDESKFSSHREYVSEMGVKQDIVDIVTSGGVSIFDIVCDCICLKSNAFKNGIVAVMAGLLVLQANDCVGGTLDVCGAI